MRKFSILTAIILGLAMLVGSPNTLSAQGGKKVRPSLKASVSQTIGVDTEITIVYSRPGVKGRTIWGDLVPWGLAPGNKYSDNKPYPWRAGANESTTFEVSKDVLINGQKLAAGKYSLHMIPAENAEWTVMFNTVSDTWGSYKYDESKDALRIKVKPVEAPHQEWLTYGFEDLAGTEATAYMHWEKVKIPFKVAVAE